ncbi:MAG: GTP-binding protein [Thermodesulfobacteriota bacterium]
MEERELHIVIVGHVDHGKSTLVGRLFYDTGCLSPSKMEEIRESSAAEGADGKIEFAHVMDCLQEERDQGITIDIAHTFFHTDRRRYVIIDAPGHREFLKNMISGTSQAEAAIMLVDAARGVEEQTLRHCHVLGLLGIKQVAVLLNKMDLTGYSQDSFTTVKNDIGKVLTGLGITPSYVIPISAMEGDNVAAKSENMKWYDGPTVLSALDSFESVKAKDRGMRFPVQDVYDIDGQSIAVGRVEAGVLRAGEDVVILPDTTKARLGEIKKYLEEGIKEAPAGDAVGITVEGITLKRGQIVVDKVESKVTDTVRANIFWMVDKDYTLGKSLTFKCATQDVKGTIDKIYQRFDPASIEVVERDASVIKPSEVAEVEIKLDNPVVVDSFLSIQETGRFVLEHDGFTVAGGIIL